MLSLQHGPVLATPVSGIIWIYAGLGIVIERLDPVQNSKFGSRLRGGVDTVEKSTPICGFRI